LRMKSSSKTASVKSSRPDRGSVSGKLAASKGKQTKARAQSIPESGPATIVVRDDLGNDVTPRSLLPSAPAIAKPPGGEAESGSNQSSAFDSAFGKGGAGMSSMGSEGEVAGGMKTPEVSGDEASASEAGEIAPSHLSAVESAAAPALAETAPAPKFTEAALENLVSFDLSETETFFLTPYMPGECVAMDATDADAVKAANLRYDALLANRVTMADLYVETPAQTFNPDKKTKEMQTSTVKTVEMASQATSWDLYDVLVAGGVERGTEDEAVDVESVGGIMSGTRTGVAHGEASAAGSSFAASGTEASSVEGGGGNVTGETPVGEGADGDTAEKVKEVNLKTLHGMPEVLRIVERMVSQNTYQAKHLQYRHISPPGMSKPSPARGDDSSGASERSGSGGFSILWSFASEASQGRNVACLEWNPGNRDLLAAGYGEFDFARQRSDGLILFWSLKNPESPDKAIRAACGVTAIAFSNQHPNLLAAGLYDGTVCIFDVRKDSSKPILESGHGTGGKHTDPVWQLVWVDQGTERGEILVSISSDGRVTKWDMKKGLENQDLMKLKRVANVAKQAGSDGNSSSGSSEGIISRRASGMCIAFSPRDPSLYMAGTEDGPIHKCSCSYNEQHLESFFGHSGPVYKLRWSPFCPNTFLSCSADWSIKLWHQESPNAIFTFFSTTDYVADVCWSPYNSTVFASVTGDGRVDVWDVSVSTLDPLASVKTGKRLSTVAFSLASPVLVVGHEGGGVDVYSLEGSLAEPTGRTVAEQIAALDKHMVTEDTKPVDVH